MAGWQSGYAAACKAVYLGSTPGPASISIFEITDTFNFLVRHAGIAYPNVYPEFVGYGFVMV